MGIYAAKTHLSQLCEEISRTGEACLILKNGKPLVKVVPYKTEQELSSVWDTVEESRSKYGPLKPFSLPPREYRKDPARSILDEEQASSAKGSR